jgi:antitoxin component of MazEF toxin-antitoxin module
MCKRLVPTPDGLALVFDRELLEATGIDAETALEVSTQGDVIVVSRVRDGTRLDDLQRSMEKADARYAGVFRRLVD